MAFDLFQYTDQHRHQELYVIHDHATGLRGIIAIHSTVRGPALGGTRLWHYGNTEKALVDVLRLSEGMTYKAATAGLPLGGGKAVIMADGKEASDPALRAARFEAFGAFVERLNGRFITAEDIGTTTEDMVVMRRKTRHVVGLPGVGGDPSPVTAYGVLRGMQAMIEETLDTDSFTNVSVAIQGLGKVGMSLAKLLLERGAVITATDARAEARQAAKELGIAIVSPKQIYDAPCSIFAPCALGGILNDETIPRLRCKIVAGSANNQLAEPRHAEKLQAREIRYAVDYIVNAGGLINVAMELEGYDPQRVLRKVDAIYDTIKLTLQRSRSEGITTAQAGWEIAAERLL
jgi:leucine dehydrogenase